MLRGISIHIGVNETATGHVVLEESEAHAWQMAELASQAGFQAIHVLRGAEATCVAVQCQIAAATRGLLPGDVLLVSYSGHGSQTPDLNGDEGKSDGQDETWCLFDGNLVDDRLAECWRLAPTGARIVVVAESCYGGGTPRWGEVDLFGETDTPPTWGDEYGDTEIVYRGVQAFTPSPACITTPPADANGISASVLVLAGAGENQQGQEGLYIPRLLEIWNGGSFRGSYCDLHRQVTSCVRAEAYQHEPAILMLGFPDLEFPEQPAFRLDVPVTRGGIH